MAFSHFKSIEQVIQQYPLKIRQEKFLPNQPRELPDWFIENLNFSLGQQPIQQSEAFLCESFIFPFLQQAWKYHPKLILWSHRSLTYDNNLFGEPDYLVSAWRDEVIDKLINLPLLAITEAKKQDFESGWGQCLAEMIACQNINQNESVTIYGIVSTGILWEFSKLERNTFTKHSISYSVAEPQRIFGLLDHIFTECEQQI